MDLAPLGCLVLSRQSPTELPLTFQKLFFFLLKDLAVAEDPQDALDQLVGCWSRGELSWGRWGEGRFGPDVCSLQAFRKK